MQRTIQHLDFIINHSSKTCQHLDSRELNSVQFFCVGLLERLTSSSKALKVLLQNINGNQSLEYSCGIILRSSLLDSIIVWNLYKVQLENEKALKGEAEMKKDATEYCEIILSDGITHTLQYIQASKRMKIISQQQLEEIFKTIAANYSRFFQTYANDGSTPILKNPKYFSPTKLFERLANTTELKELTKIYDAYLFFSKYDHFGIFYYEVKQRNYLEKLQKISISVEILIGAQSVLHKVLREFSNNDTFLNLQSNIAAYYLIERILNRKSDNENQKFEETIY